MTEPAAPISPAAATDKRRSILWLVAFLALAALFFWVDESAWFQARVLRPYAVMLAALTTQAAGLLGLAASREGAVVVTSSLRFEFASSCTGSFVFLLFAAAVIPFPVPVRSRLQGLLAGFTGIFLLNLVRGIMIVVVSARFPGALWTLHIVIGQILVIVGVLAIFVWWVGRAQAGRPLLRLPANRAVVRALLLFAAGYLAGHVFYFHFFIFSPLADWLRDLIMRHAAALLALFMPASSHKAHLSTAAMSIQLTPACLHSPVVVVLAAVAFAWPARWWKKALALLLGFLPVFYLFNLGRVCLIVATSPLNPSGEHSFMHTFFGPLILTALLVALGGYEWCIRRRIVPPRRYLAALGISLAAAAALAWGGGWISRQFLVPLVTQAIHGRPGLSYDPEQTLSRMAAVMVFLWTLLAGITPGLSVRRKLAAAGAGLLGALAFSGAFVAGCEILHLSPYIRLIKAVTLAIPVAIYLLVLYSPAKNAASAERRVSPV